MNGSFPPGTPSDRGRSDEGAESTDRNERRDRRPESDDEEGSERQRGGDGGWGTGTVAGVGGRLILHDAWAEGPIGCAVGDHISDF